MTNTKAKLLFEAIVKDDLKSFNNLISEPIDFKIRFGRFPMLSVCYLYKSFKILNKYEDKLNKLSDFIKVYEPLELCRRFDKLSKKALRLYLADDTIVYPIEMLAIIDSRNALVNKFNKLYKNDKIINNIKKIYNLNNNLDIAISYNKLEIKTKKLSLRQKCATICLLVALVFVLLISGGSLLLISNSTGLGLKTNPIKITNEDEFISALENGKNHYVLENDITLTRFIDSFDFSGELNGNGHTLNASDKLVNGLTKNNSGKIENLNLSIDYTDLKLKSNFGILAENLSGSLINCKVFGSVNLDVVAKQDVAGGDEAEIYFAVFASNCTGQIVGSESSVNIVAKNDNSINAYVSGIVGKNFGTILGCKNTAERYVTDTVDIAGIVIENSGTIKEVENIANLTQTSAANTWNPNVAGIAMNNRGSIKDCTNSGELLSNSTAETLKGDNLISVIVAGIAINNYNLVEDCKNVGDITAKSVVAEICAGGIVCQNISQDDVKAKISLCLSSCDLIANAESSDVYVAGIVSQSRGDIISSTFIGKIKVSGNDVFSAGICSYSLYSTISGCRSEVIFDAAKQTETQNSYTICAVAMFVWDRYILDNEKFEFVPIAYSNNNTYLKNDTFEHSATKLIRIFDIEDKKYKIVGFINSDYADESCGCKAQEEANNETGL